MSSKESAKLYYLCGYVKGWTSNFKELVLRRDSALTSAMLDELERLKEEVDRLLKASKLHTNLEQGSEK